MVEAGCSNRTTHADRLGLIARITRRGEEVDPGAAATGGTGRPGIASSWSHLVEKESGAGVHLMASSTLRAARRPSTLLTRSASEAGFNPAPGLAALGAERPRNTGETSAVGPSSLPMPTPQPLREISGPSIPVRRHLHSAGGRWAPTVRGRPQTYRPRQRLEDATETEIPSEADRTSAGHGTPPVLDSWERLHRGPGRHRLRRHRHYSRFARPASGRGPPEVRGGSCEGLGRSGGASWDGARLPNTMSPGPAVGGCLLHPVSATACRAPNPTASSQVTPDSSRRTLRALTASASSALGTPADPATRSPWM